MDRSPENFYSPIESEQSLVQRFNSYFDAVSADTPEAIKIAFALRYQVYCIERQFEDPARQFNCLESDELDCRSVHCLLFYRPQAKAIGTARLILPSAVPESLPIQQVLRINGIDAGDYFPNDNVAEVSRFAISKDFRRRTFEEIRSGPAQSLSELRSNLPLLGLVQVLLRQSLEMGRDHWGALMEPQLLRLLSAMGINFQPIGPMVSHHGLRQPCYCCLPRMLKELEIAKPDNWVVVSNDGELYYRTAQRFTRSVRAPSQPGQAF